MSGFKVVRPCVGRLLDLLIETALPLPTTGAGNSLKRRKAFYKNSISIVCWPILRSS